MMIKGRFIFVICLLLLSSCSSITTSSNSQRLIIDGNQQESNNTPTDRILIDLKGAVSIPGIYEISSGTPLFILINEYAGGLLEDADVEQINMVTLLSCNQMVVIPKYKEREDLDTSSSSITSNLININYASIELLCKIPKIGESKAKNIINYRKENGLFSSINDITKVSGIGDALFSQIKKYICV